jgi:hypothetical protein
VHGFAEVNKADSSSLSCARCVLVLRMRNHECWRGPSFSLHPVGSESLSCLIRPLPRSRLRWLAHMQHQMLLPQKGDNVCYTSNIYALLSRFKALPQALFPHT